MKALDLIDQCNSCFQNAQLYTKATITTPVKNEPPC